VARSCGAGRSAFPPLWSIERISKGQSFNEYTALARALPRSRLVSLNGLQTDVAVRAERVGSGRVEHSTAAQAPDTFTPK